MMNSSLMKPIALLCGTVIGAGVLGIPYVVAKAGFLTGLLTIIILGLAVLMLNLFLGEVILRTPGNHQLPGYAEKYLGKYGKKIMVFSMFFGIYGALIAYIIGEGQALSAIFGLTPSTFSIIFFIVSSALIYKGLKTITQSELFLASIVLVLVLVIALISIFSTHFNISNLTNFNINNIMIPYGVILFAFLGMAAIPEMKECLIRDRKKLKKAIIIGSLIPVIAYTLFTLAIIGVTGVNTTEISTIGLGNYLGETMIVFGNIFAIFAMFTSFLTLAYAMKEIYAYDYKIKPFFAWFLTISIPAIAILLGAKDFIQVLGTTGALSGGISGILIVLMFWKARKKGGRIPEYKLGKRLLIGLILILIFLIGIINQVL